MQINFTPEQQAFLEARFETNDIQPIVEKYLNDWLDHLVEVAHSRIPPAANKIQAATADILTKTEEAEIRKAEREALKNK